MMRKAVSYYRVSTAKQGKSGLGLEAQRKAIEDFTSAGNWQIIGEFIEIESGKLDRPLSGGGVITLRTHRRDANCGEARSVESKRRISCCFAG